jgi:hypothetical protein
MSLAAGNRDTYLTIWTVTDSTADAAGGINPVPVKKCHAWGEIKAFVPGPNAAGVKGQREEWNSFHQITNANYVVTIPYISGVSATDQITGRFRGQTFTMNIAGDPLINGGDLIIPVRLVVN